jgi:hypothetical protein
MYVMVNEKWGIVNGFTVKNFTQKNKYPNLCIVPKNLGT